MMENLNIKTRLASKAKAITGVLMALAAASAVSVASTAEAFTVKGLAADTTPYIYTSATGNTQDDARANVYNKAVAICSKRKGGGDLGLHYWVDVMPTFSKGYTAVFAYQCFA
ncbi:MAG TPA: hypothetical protein VF427_06960 [Noviherbaspirillum sp.]